MAQHFQNLEGKKYWGNKQKIDIPIHRFSAPKSYIPSPADIKQIDTFLTGVNLPSEAREPQGSSPLKR
jgi:hypothetical protein